MTNSKMGPIFVDEIIDNPDGTATVRMTIPDETKEAIMQKYGWTEWSDDEFQKMALEALRKAVDEKEAK
jgi:hypothetical protein